jgi:hypothetical protein
MPNVMKRGAKPSPRHELAAATPYIALPRVPATHLIHPAKLSVWHNDKHGDCVTAEEAFAKACHRPEIFITDNVVAKWAQDHGVYEGANLVEVLKFMQNSGFAEDGRAYDDGPYNSVDWTDEATLKSAIYIGPVKIGVAADQLETACQATDFKTGWFATGFHTDTREDHCTSLCGYGSIDWLAGKLGAKIPAGVDKTKPGYAMFTWGGIGVIDVPSLVAITSEAWVRHPTTVVV